MSLFNKFNNAEIAISLKTNTNLKDRTTLAISISLKKQTAAIPQKYNNLNTRQISTIFPSFQIQMQGGESFVDGAEK
jgi:hypothetical protein